MTGAKQAIRDERARVLTSEHLFSIELFGQSYTFKTQSEIQRAKEVADYLANEVAKLEQLQGHQTSRMDHKAVVILAALNIANEFLEMDRYTREFFRELSGRSATLIRKLDRSLNHLVDNVDCSRQPSV